MTSPDHRPQAANTPSSYRATRLKLRDGSQVLVQASIGQVQETLETALRRGQLVQIDGPDGSALISPAVVSAHEDPDSAASLARRLASDARAS